MTVTRDSIEEFVKTALDHLNITEEEMKPIVELFHAYARAIKNN